MNALRDQFSCEPVPHFAQLARDEWPFELVPSRCVAAWVHGLMRGGFIFASIYLWTGRPPTDSVNWSILMTLAAAINSSGLPFIAGGDWNCDPEALRSSGFLELVGAVIISVQNVSGTCRGGRLTVTWTGLFCLSVWFSISLTRP